MLHIDHGLDLTKRTLYLIVLDQLILADNFHCVIPVVLLALHFVNFAECAPVEILYDLEVGQGDFILRFFTFDQRK